MNVYHFMYTHPSSTIGDLPVVLDFFCAGDDDILANERFEEFSHGVAYDNCWVYDNEMDARVAKDAAHFAYDTCFSLQTSDDLMVAVLHKQPAIVDHSLLIDACRDSTPNTLRMILALLPNDTIAPKYPRQAIFHRNEASLEILIDSGRVKDNGELLAAACETGQRRLFDLVLPVSNPQFALHFEPKINSEWLNEAIAQQQKERLQQVVQTSGASRARKI